VEENLLKEFCVIDHWGEPKNMDPETTVIVLRDPVDRFTSAFFYMKTFYPEDVLSLEKDVRPPSDLVKRLMVGNGEHLLYEGTQKIGSLKLETNWVWTPQHFWYNGAKHVLFYETINEDFENFLKMTNRELVKLPVVNASEKTEFSYEDNEIEYLKQRYSEDYRLIEKVRRGER
jgi:hypothetical protein